MTPGWDQKKPSAFLCRDQTCWPWLHWLEEQGPSSRRQRPCVRSPERGSPFQAGQRRLTPHFLPHLLTWAQGEPRMGRSEKAGHRGSFPSSASNLRGQLLEQSPVRLPCHPAGGDRISRRAQGFPGSQVRLESQQICCLPRVLRSGERDAGEI